MEPKRVLVDPVVLWFVIGTVAFASCNIGLVTAVVIARLTGRVP